MPEVPAIGFGANEFARAHFDGYEADERGYDHYECGYGQNERAHGGNTSDMGDLGVNMDGIRLRVTKITAPVL